MANNKIVYNGQTLIDLTGDTAVAEDVAQGKTFHLADGTQATGTASGGGGDTLYEAYTQTGFSYENNNITTIPNYMLYYSKVASISSSSVTSVGNYAFNGCSALTSIDLPQLTTIGNYSFQQCTGLTTLNLPVITINQNAFYRCTNLTSISLPNCTSIAGSAFRNTSVPSGVELIVNLPECTSLGNYAFGYSPVKSVSIPKIQTLGQNVFDRCTNLTSITIPSTVSGSLYGLCYGCTNLQSVTLSDGITSISNMGSSFYNCSSLTSITVPGTVTALQTTFYGCTSLTSVTFTGHVAQVGAQSFYNCTNCLVYDFSHCTSVPRLMSTNAFYGINENAQIRVPAALESEWKTEANWFSFESYIVGV